MIYLGICLTLLTLIASLYLLAKIRKEELGSFTKWITYLIILVALLTLGCQLARGFRMMCRPHEKGDHWEQCGPGMPGRCSEMMMMHGGMRGCMEDRCEHEMMKGKDSDACCMHGDSSSREEIHKEAEEKAHSK